MLPTLEPYGGSMRVVLDTNVLAADRFLRGPHLRTLFDSADKAGHSVCIPRVVLEETTRQYEEELETTMRQHKKTLRELTLAFGRELESPTAGADVSLATARYRSNIEGNNITIIDYPAVSHDDVIKRDLSRRKPFSQDGRGYRDTLIWETVLGMASTGDQIALITNDKDFRSKDSGLHEHLCQDLAAEGISPDKVVLFRDVREFIDSHIRPYLEVFDVLRPTIESGQLAGVDVNELISLAGVDVNELISLTVQDFYAGEVWKTEELNLRWEYESPTLDMVEEVSGIKVTDIRRLPDGEMLARIEADLTTDFYVYLFKADYYALYDNPDLYLIDGDWNDHYVLASTTKDLHGVFDLIVDTDDPGDASVDIVEIEPIETLDY